MYKKKSIVPLGVLFIGSFYAFGAMALLVFLLINATQISRIIAERHGLVATTGEWILPVIAGLGLLMSYGIISLSRWGYVLTIFYLT